MSISEKKIKILRDGTLCVTVDDFQKVKRVLVQDNYNFGGLYYPDNVPSADRPQEWIPCSKRLPEIGEYHISEPCIVYCKGGVYAFAELEENIFGQVEWNCERDNDYHEPIGKVVAWMPLPKPWKGAWKGVDDELV